MTHRPMTPEKMIETWKRLHAEGACVVISDGIDRGQTYTYCDIQWEGPDGYDAHAETRNNTGDPLDVFARAYEEYLERTK